MKMLAILILVLSLTIIVNIQLLNILSNFRTHFDHNFLALEIHKMIRKSTTRLVQGLKTD